MMDQGNRAYLLTAPGAAAIAVVRIVGDGVPGLLRACFSRPVVALRCVHGELRDGEEVIDDPVVVLHEDGRAADVALHGGPWVVRRCLDLLMRHGFKAVDRISTPLPPAAVDGDDPIERAVLQHLPMARTNLALRILLGQVAAWQRVLTQPPPSETLEHIAADRALINLLRLPRLAIVGPPNVGKSTLANQLFAQERSITADLPGTTRDWVGEIADIDGLAVMLIDTPGQRATTDTIEAQAIDQSRHQIIAADLVLLVTDPGTPAAVAEALAEPGQPTLLVRNKADLAAGREGRRRSDDAVDGIATIATTGEGVDRLRRAILEHFGCANLDTHQARPWSEMHAKRLVAAAVDGSRLKYAIPG